jgi:hypothetical protein
MEMDENSHTHPKVCIFLDFVVIHQFHHLKKSKFITKYLLKIFCIAFEQSIAQKKTPLTAGFPSMRSCCILIAMEITFIWG